MEGYCPLCNVELGVCYYAETIVCPVCGGKFQPESLLKNPIKEERKDA